jgi:hypothetical protein
MPSAAAKTLADLAPVLESLGLRWYLFGAQAAIHYGSPRATADVDVTVELAARTYVELLRALESAGIAPRLELDDAFVERARVLPLVHTATGMGVDVVLAGPGPEDAFLARARQASFEGVEVRIASPTDIVVMKILAGRPKDLDDVAGILRARPPDLDPGEARGLLAELDVILGQSDLARAFDAAKQRAGSK